MSVTAVSTTPDELRTLYRDKALMFLMANNRDEDQVKTSACTGNNTASPITDISRSLIMRSCYDTGVSAGVDNVNTSSCVLPCKGVNIEKQSLIRSGAHKIPVPLEMAELVMRRKADNTGISSHGSSCLGNKFDVDAMEVKNGRFIHSLFTDQSCPSAVCHDFFCKCCGRCLLPMPIFDKDKLGAVSYASQIRLKRMKRSKTRRRRASRYAAKKYVYDTNILQKQKGGGRSFAQVDVADSLHSWNQGKAVASYSRTIAALKSVAAKRRIHDGMCKNVIKYKCQCGYEMSVKGVKACDARKVSNCNKPNPEHDQRCQESSKVELTMGKQGEEFIALGATKHMNKTSTIGIQPIQKKGNKKRGPTAKKNSGSKSKLQDFLSSLND